MKDVKMAEGGSQNVLCRYFINGACREGERCRYSHNRDAARPSMVCRYYLRGTCVYGQQCRYDHVRPDHSRPDIWQEPPSDRTSSESERQASRHRGGGSGDDGRNQSSQPSKLGVSAHAKEFVYNPTNGASATIGFRNLSNSSSSNSSSSSNNHTSNIISSSSTNSSNNLPSLSSRQRNQESSCGGSPASWVDAPEFVPRFAKDNINKQYDVSYAQVAGAGDKGSSGGSNSGARSSDSEFCSSYLMTGICEVGDHCTYIHGQFCEMCQLAYLHPYDKEQRRIHREECTKLIEAEMEHSFAVARSRDKVCGICMDTVMERPLASQRRFGILPNCGHCFCLNCIRKWRQSKQFENKIVRSCPECRTQSDFVVPSRYWVDDKDKEEKDKLLISYQHALSAKPCKYFKQGEGQCPFGNKCFYLHALPDGTKKDVGPPRRRRRFAADGELQLYLDNMVLWDFIEEREHRLELLRGSIQTLLLELELEDLADDFYFADDSVSETSDL
ncbi:probable E3 ubiquitin-protein ligase makorin-1 isoform X1 [Penaeus chinensis]|uniref:probable E3 ubiquitin-protein ligase makorin-1 isoform X1 n=1 Tax=Penaeus chinensis TaxID=139456 RepID=UPI001FB57C2B|nr:probable E3 ubiquitin-protein ligase makorin-1 isoform X1 [Penaeus chinensis]